MPSRLCITLTVLPKDFSCSLFKNFFVLKHLNTETATSLYLSIKTLKLPCLSKDSIKSIFYIIFYEVHFQAINMPQTVFVTKLLPGNLLAEEILPDS